MSEIKNKFSELSDDILDDVAGGATGYAGQHGLAGYQGQTGYGGYQGQTGQAGLAGQTGQAGLAGYKGVTGHAGSFGHRGLAGLMNGGKGKGKNIKDKNDGTNKALK